jgi:hypothetical protein
VVQVAHHENRTDTNEKNHGGKGEGGPEKNLLEAIQLPSGSGHRRRLSVRSQDDTEMNNRQ